MQPQTISRRRTTNDKRHLVKAIIAAGLLAGTLDMIGAIIVYQVNPGSMFRFIASGAFGADTAFSGGPTMVILGILFHYIIAFAWTILFFLVYPIISILWKNKYITGALYGIFISIIMNKIVIPLSAIRQGSINLTAAAIAVSILIVAVGLPIALLANRYYSHRGIPNSNS